MKRIALDTETTGADFWHGCKPFFVSICDEEGNLNYYEWSVDPFTRVPQVPLGELEELTDIICESDEMICHNATFDMRAMESLWSMPHFQQKWFPEWDWSTIHDTMVMSHALQNLWPHGLKPLREIFFLRHGAEEALRVATKRARGICRTKKFKAKHGTWRLANEGDPHFPGAKKPKSRDGSEGWWPLDTWLLSELVQRAPEFLPSENEKGGIYTKANSNYLLHPWESLVEVYAIEDAVYTMALYWVLESALKEEELWDQYLQRMEVLKVCYDMESEGVTLTKDIGEIEERYRDKVKSLKLSCWSTAEFVLRTGSLTSVNAERKGFNLNSPKQLRELLFTRNGWNLPSIKDTPSGENSVDASVLEELLTLRNNKTSSLSIPEDAEKFIKDLLTMRRNLKSADYISSYRKHSREETTKTRSAESNWAFRDQPIHAPYPHGNNSKVPWKYTSVLRANFNLTGTKFTRQSSSSPNLQNIGTGKKENGELDYELREVFGPVKGRKWLCFDYSNIELRIWGYECGNKEFIHAFENDISVHLLIARELHPSFKSISDDTFKKTREYKTTKNGDFAIVYGASPAVADATYGIPGAYRKLSKRFPEVAEYTQYLHGLVQDHGYVETLTGYRLYIPPEEPHKAVSGRVQGTAGSVIGHAMAACNDWLRLHRPEAKLILQIHDELVFDVPVSFPEKDMRYIKKLMERQGEKIGLPLPVSGEVVTKTWNNGHPLNL